MKISLKTKILALLLIGLTPIIAKANMMIDPITLSVAIAVVVLVNAGLEIIASLFFLFIQKVNKKKRIISFVFLANIISYPIFFISLFYLDSLLYSLSILNNNYDARLGIIGFFLEILVVIFEYFFIYHWNKENLTKKQTLSLCIINNASSLIISFFINPFFG
jgi:hypothetical protein